MRKLKLEDLQVESFVTTPTGGMEAGTVQGYDASYFNTSCYQCDPPDTFGAGACDTESIHCGGGSGVCRCGTDGLEPDPSCCDWTCAGISGGCLEPC